MDADRVLADLRELARLTGGPDGARRVCWTDEWARARSFLRSRLDELPVEVDVDEAGNLWAGLEGESSTGSVRHTFCRGELVYDRGEIKTQPGHGRFTPRSLGAPAAVAT